MGYSCLTRRGTLLFPSSVKDKDMVNRTRRSGFTLFEIVMTMAVILILSAIVYPSIKNMYGAHKLDGAIDSVRGAWAEARARAIHEGRPYRVSVEPGKSIEPSGTHFRVAPDDQDYWSGTGGSKPDNDANGKALILVNSLPSGVHLSINGDSSSPPPETSDAGVNEKESKPSGEWTTVAVFLPNGEARDDVKITFQVRGVRPKVLQLRGLTGSVAVQTETH